MARTVPVEVKIGDLPEVKEMLSKAADEIERLREGLQRLHDLNFDAGYTMQDWAAAVLDGSEPAIQNTSEAEDAATEPALLRRPVTSSRPEQHDDPSGGSDG